MIVLGQFTLINYTEALSKYIYLVSKKVTTSLLSLMTVFSRFGIRNQHNMNVFLSQMAVFSQLGIRIDVNLIPFFKITKKGINKGFSTNAFLSQMTVFSRFGIRNP